MTRREIDSSIEVQVGSPTDVPTVLRSMLRRFSERCSAVPRRTGVADVCTVPDDVLTSRTGSRLLDTVRCEDAGVVGRNERPTVLTLHHRPVVVKTSTINLVWQRVPVSLPAVIPDRYRRFWRHNPTSTAVSRRRVGIGAVVSPLVPWCGHCVVCLHWCREKSAPACGNGHRARRRVDTGMRGARHRLPSVDTRSVRWTRAVCGWTRAAFARCGDPD